MRAKVTTAIKKCRKQEEDKDVYGVSRTLACDFPGTRGDLLVALLTTFFSQANIALPPL